MLNANVYEKYEKYEDKKNWNTELTYEASVKIADILMVTTTTSYD